MIFDIINLPILSIIWRQYLGLRLMDKIFYIDFTFVVYVFNGNGVFLPGKWLEIKLLSKNTNSCDRLVLN